jgi:hypothetical protein
MAFASPPCHKQIEVSSMLIFKTGLPWEPVCNTSSTTAKLRMPRYVLYVGPKTSSIWSRLASSKRSRRYCFQYSELESVSPGELESVSLSDPTPG